MAIGAEGVVPTDTDSPDAGDGPQTFEADTVTVPPAGPAVAVMEEVVDVPVHPPGSVHV
jgi:hypothetical protein